MSYGDTNCIENLIRVTGYDGCETDLSATRRLWITLPDFQFDTEADAKDETKLDDAVNAGNIFILPKVVLVEDGSEETQIEEAQLGDRFLTREGKRIVTYSCAVPLCVHKKLRDLNGTADLRLIRVDKNKNILGNTPDGVIFKGVEIGFIHVGKITESDGTVVRKSPIMIVEEYPEELDDNGAAFKVTYNPLKKEGLKGVNLTMVSQSATELVFTAKSGCGGTVLTSFVEADFLVLKADGSAQDTITSILFANGVYTVVGVGMVTGTLNLDTPANMTTKGFKSDGAASYTI